MIHFHLGSQIANVQDIQRGMREAARFYAELRALGADRQRWMWAAPGRGLRGTARARPAR